MPLRDHRNSFSTYLFVDLAPVARHHLMVLPFGKVRQKSSSASLSDSPHLHTPVHPQSLFSYDVDLFGTGDFATPYSFPLVAAGHPAFLPWVSVPLGLQQKQACQAREESVGRGALDDAPIARWYQETPGATFQPRGCEQPHR